MEEVSFTKEEIQTMMQELFNESTQVRRFVLLQNKLNPRPTEEVVDE